MQKLDNDKVFWNRNKVDSILFNLYKNVHIRRLNEEGGYLEVNDFRYIKIHPHNRKYIGSIQMYKDLTFLFQFAEDNDLVVGKPIVKRIGRRLFYNSDAAKTFNKLMILFGFRI